MEENENAVVDSKNERKPLPFRTILKLLFVLCIGLAFCPSFVVSCSGNELNVSTIDAARGVTFSGDELDKAHPIVLGCLVAPIVALVVLLIKRKPSKASSVVVTVLSIVDMVFWLLFKSGAERIANENGCGIRTTPWFIVTIILVSCCILLSALSVVYDE